jgi:hypothetical protein
MDSLRAGNFSCVRTTINYISNLLIYLFFVFSTLSENDFTVDTGVWFMGGVAGFSAGLSRVPVVGTVIPAMLTLVSGFLGYLFGKEHLKEWRLVIPFCILIFTFNSLIGLFIGSQMRGKSEDYERQYNEWLLHYEKVDLEADKKEALEEPKNNIDKESK